MFSWFWAKGFHARKQQLRAPANSVDQPKLIADWDFARRVAVLKTAEGECVAKRLEAAQPAKNNKSQVIGIFQLDGKEVPVPVGMIWWGMIVAASTTAAEASAVIRPVQKKNSPAPRRAK